MQKLAGWLSVFKWFIETTLAGWVLASSVCARWLGHLDGFYVPERPWSIVGVCVRVCMHVCVCVNVRVVFEWREAQPGVDSGSSLYHSGYSFCSAHWREILFFPLIWHFSRHYWDSIRTSGKLAHECTKQHTLRKLKKKIERNVHSINCCHVSSANATRAMLGRDLQKSGYWVFRLSAWYLKRQNTFSWSSQLSTVSFWCIQHTYSNQPENACMPCPQGTFHFQKDVSAPLICRPCDSWFLKSCVRARAEQGNINHSAYGTWTADFMLRQNESRAFLGKYLDDLRVPWRHKRREMMAIIGIIPEQVAKCLQIPNSDQM